MFRLLALATIPILACTTGNIGGMGLEKCTMAEARTSRCSGGSLMYCQCSNGTDPVDGSCPWNTELAYIQTQDCTAIGQMCVEESAGVAACVDELPIVGELEVCKDGQGNDVGTCGDDMVCSESLLGNSACISPCVGTCPSGSYCEDEASLFTPDHCYPEADELEVCLPTGNDDACVGDSVCEWTAYGDWAYECHTLCDGGDVNTGQAGCPSNRECLAGPYVEIERDAWGGLVSCTNPGTVDACTGADQFLCFTLKLANTSANLCARDVGWCGIPAKLHTDISLAYMDSLLPAYNGDRTLLCNVLKSPYRCGPPPDGTAEVECARLGQRLIVWQDGNGDLYPCPDDAATQDVDEGSLACALNSLGTCYQTIVGHVCAIPQKGCFAFCDDPFDVDGQRELVCPSGTVCSEQTLGFDHLIGQIDIEETGTPPVWKMCTVEGDCDTLKRYSCVNIGSATSPNRFCIRARKVCTGT